MLTNISTRLLQINNGLLLKCAPINIKKFSSSVEVESEVEVFDQDATEKLEKKIKRARNVSQLNIYHRRLLDDKLPYPEPLAEHHLTVKYKRRMYGIYGEASGVNPGIMWPTKEDIEDRKEYERVGYPLTIQEMVRNEVSRLEEKEAEIWERQNQIKQNLGNLNKWIKDMEARKKKKLEVAQAAKAKKDRLIEEVKRHFGYAISDRDEKFQEMVEKKQKEEKKALKLEKNKLRQDLYFKTLMAEADKQAEKKAELAKEKQEKASKKENIVSDTKDVKE